MMCSLKYLREGLTTDDGVPVASTPGDTAGGREQNAKQGGKNAQTWDTWFWYSAVPSLVGGAYFANRPPPLPTIIHQFEFPYGLVTEDAVR